MRRLAEVGFQQSYTYFTWRNSRSRRSSSYASELAGPARPLHAAQLLRQHPRHPPEYLQHSGPAGVRRSGRRSAATLSPTYGVYSGFELYEHVAVRPGSEEYLDSEKYQYRPRDWELARKQGAPSRRTSPSSTRIRRRATRHCRTCRSLRFHAQRQRRRHRLLQARRRRRRARRLHARSRPRARGDHVVGHGWPRAAARTTASSRTTSSRRLTWTSGASTYVRLRPWEHVAHVVHVRTPLTLAPTPAPESHMPNRPRPAPTPARRRPVLDLDRLVDGWHHDPHSILGPHVDDRCRHGVASCGPARRP